MSDSLSNLILFGDGWHLVERYNDTSFVWTTNESELWFEHNFEKIEIELDCFHLNVHPLVIIKDTVSESIQLNAGLNVIKISTENVNKIVLKYPTFIPKNVLKESSDPRELGIRITSISVYYSNKKYDINIGEILSKRYLDIKTKSLISLTQRTSVQSYSKKINSQFEKIYCISTRKDWIRRLHALQQYDKFGLNFEFVSSIDPDIIAPHVNNITKEEGSLCYTTKWCLENAKINNYSSIVIMEDDFQFSENWMNDWIMFYKNLPDDWDFLHLGQASWWDGISDKKCVSINDYVDRIEYGCGAHFIVIRETIYDLCINLLSTLSTKVDICYWEIMKDKKYNCYSPKNNLANSMSSPDKMYVSKIPEFVLTQYFPSRLNVK